MLSSFLELFNINYILLRLARSILYDLYFSYFFLHNRIFGPYLNRSNFKCQCFYSTKKKSRIYSQYRSNCSIVAADKNASNLVF